jgi:hypothetical protein
MVFALSVYLQEKPMNFIKTAVFAATVALAGVSSIAHAGLINDAIDLTGP